LVIPTDGVIDQIGQVKRIAHGKKRVVNFVQQHRQETARELVNKFGEHFVEWQGTEKRRDDVTLLAFRTAG
jgi:serine phosphatase RsbU (regulator of sigma subunit)